MRAFFRSLQPDQRLLPLLACLLIGSPSASAQTKPRPNTALVIGNSRYEHSLGRLRNAENDAAAIATTLRALGFTVIEKTNVNRDQLAQCVDAFRKTLRGAEIAIFYYAGHGVSIGGSNYLVPIKSGFEPSQSDPATAKLMAETRLFNAEQAVADMGAGGALCNLVILDACRTPPSMSSETVRSFSDQKGLSEMRPPAGSLIAFAADDGQVAFDGDGRNGLFTEELLRNMRTPGLTIEQVFKKTRAAVIERTQGRQVPAEYSRLVGDDVYLAGKRDEPATLASDAAIPKETPDPKPFNPNPISALREWPTNGGLEADLVKLVSSVLDDAKVSLQDADSPSPRIVLVAEQCAELSKLLPTLFPENDPRYRAFQAKALSRRGDALLLLSKPEEALECFQTAVPLDPEDAYLLYNRGRAFLSLGKKEEAKADFNAAAGPRFNQSGAKRLALAALLSLK